jgi:hypothetical protein
MTQHRLSLPGCAPIPLAHYLKALGILRLVAEDRERGDPAAAGCWDRDVFILHSRLDREVSEGGTVGLPKMVNKLRPFMRRREP